MGAIAHYVFFLIPVGRGKFINDTSLQVAANERLLRKLMLKQAEVASHPRGQKGGMVMDIAHFVKPNIDFTG